MRRRIWTIPLLVIFIFLSSCGGRKQSPGGEEKSQSSQEGSKGYLVFINVDTPEKNVMYSMDLSGKKKKVVYDKEPYSAAGYKERIAFMSRESGREGLYIINADGSGLIQVTTGMAIRNDTITWSPDGKKLVFVGKMPNDRYDGIYYVEASQNKYPFRVTTDTFEAESPRFSNDGRSILYTAKQDAAHSIYRYETGSRTTTPIKVAAGIDNISPVVSTDGTRLLYLSDEGTKDKYNLYISDIDGGNSSKLTTDLSIVKDSVKISPDSSMVSFVTIGDRGSRSVHVMGMNRSTVLISNNSYSTAWSGDGKKLYFASFDPNNRRIVEYDVINKTMQDAVSLPYKPGEETTGIKFLHFTDRLK